MTSKTNYAVTFWYVVNLNTFGRPSIKHFTFLDAKMEAERLSMNNPGARFIVLKAEAEFFVELVKNNNATYYNQTEVPF